MYLGGNHMDELLATDPRPTDGGDLRGNSTKIRIT